MENKTEQNCLISVIVPVYNILDCLERCVNSICGQTWKNLEILLVDDGSTDGTGKLCDLLAEKDDRIRVFHKPNGGSSSARNLGISMAQGEWIGFVDSDDWIEPQMYERLYEAATAAGTSIAQASRDEIDEDYHKRPDVCTSPEQEVTCTAELREYAVRFALVQRLDYLLHIPVGRMVDTDVFYKSVKQYLRGHFSDTRKNPLLDKKSRTYLTLLTIAPKTVRRVHGWTMKLRGVG